MRLLPISRYCILAIAVFFFISCSKTTNEEFETASINEYYPLGAGKYITYRLDSTVFTNFGRNTEIHSYQEKHLVESMITDNLGRPSYRVFRYLRDTAGLQQWRQAGSFFITALSDQVELIEDNLRIIKMHLPIKNNFSWKGNKYLPANPYGSLYTFSNDDNMEDWDFHYDGESSSFSYGGKNYTGVYSIEEENEALNVPITNANAYGIKTRAVEKYSKNIGLVYREYELWEYQPNPGGSGGPFKTGFGIRQWMIDHN